MGHDLTTREKEIEDNFINVPLRADKMTFYTVRTGILERVREAVNQFHGTVLDVGCGFRPYEKLVLANDRVENYIGMDVANSEIYADGGPDINWNGIEIPLDDASVDCVMATEFLEHHSEPGAVLREMYRVMKPGGVFFATVPFIWNLHELPHDEYRYTPASLGRHVREAGFQDVKIKPIGGWNRSLAQMVGLWVGFSKMSERRRRILSRALFPFYRWLIKTDVVPEDFDGHENSMFCGLSVTAIK